MSAPDRAVRAAAADLAAAMERLAADLGLAEEPAGFLAALDAAAPRAGEPEARAGQERSAPGSLPDAGPAGRPGP